ncbi:MAG: MBL fold metallo-hydrolase [Firmicutes bacterium]|nr:MBL fold metallo-hydrolase [Bacillota bacterium]
MKNLAICSLSSGSSGNSYLVLSETTALLVDAGISARQIEQRLSEFGIGLDALRGVFITHEHQDHIKGLRVLLKKRGLPVFATEGTADGIGREDIKDLRLIQPGQKLTVGDITAESFCVSHDAAQPVCFRFSCEDRQISIVTDTGILTEEVYRCMRGADILVLESNHDENILRIGRYPWFLKQRILGDKGHLSNDAAANGLIRLLCEEPDSGRELERVVLLAHLSKENNFPQLALTTVQNMLEEEGIALGKGTRLETLSRTEMSPLYMIKERGGKK